MPIGSEFLQPQSLRSPRSRRAVMAAGGAALLGCASLGLLSLGVANAQQAITPGQTISTGPDLSLSAGPTTALSMGTDTAYFKFDSAQLKQQQDKFVSTLAGKLGVTSDKLQQALKETEQEVGPVPLLLGAGKPAFGGQAFAISMVGDLTPAAAALGIGEDQLRQQLTGKSLTDVAKAHNVDPQKVSNAIKSARLADLDQAIQSGKIPADIANRFKTKLDEEIALLMTTVRSTTGSMGEVHNMRFELTGPAE
jgi:hypothetical protein